MRDAVDITEARTLVFDTIGELLERRGAKGLEISDQSKLTEDLGMDSLELAELSAVLEDELGSDPYSEGLVPQTTAEVIDFYAS